jgi:predicted nucleotidyltransferase
LDRFVTELKGLYAEKLVGVILYGSRARGDATEDSDVDTLILLDPCDDFWAEFERIDPLASRLSFAMF